MRGSHYKRHQYLPIYKFHVRFCCCWYIKVADFTNWLPLTSGMSVCAMTAVGDWALIDQEVYLYSNSGTRLAYRSNQSAGLWAYGGGSIVQTLGGGTPGLEVVIVTYWDAALDILQLGYYKVDAGTWHWDATPSTFSAFAPSANLLYTQVIVAGFTVRKHNIYTGLPSGSDGSQAEIEAWAEANAVLEMASRVGK